MIKAFLAIGSFQVLTMLVLLVRTKGLALLLGPDLVGVMSVIDRLLAVFAQTAGLSLPFAALRFLPARWEAGAGSFLGLFGRMRNLLVSTMLLASAGGIAVAYLAPSLLGSELAPHRDVLVVAFLSLPMLTLAPFTQNVIAARFQHNRSMAFVLAHGLVFAGASLVGVLVAGLPGLYAVYGGAGLLLVITVLRRIGRSGTSGRPAETRGGPLGLPREIWRFSLALLLLAFAAPYAALFVNYQVLAHGGARVAGWMQAAFGIGLAVRAVLGAAHQVLLTPHVNRSGPAEERMAWADRFQRTFCFLAATLIPPLLLFPQLAVRVLYSGAFVPGAQFVVLFVTVEVVTLFAGTYQAFVIAFDRMGYHVLQNVVAHAITVALAWTLIPRHGILGAGLALLAAQAFLYVATRTFLRLAYGLRVPVRTTLLTAFVVAALVGTGLLGVQGVEGNVLMAVALRVASYAAVFAGLVVFLQRDDWRALGRFVVEARSRLGGVQR